MGNESGEIWVYDSIDNNISGAFRRINSDFDAVEVGRQSILAVADINSDGLPEVVVGNKRGGLSIFSAPYPTALRLTETESAEFELIPNPAKDILTIDFGHKNHKENYMFIIDPLGRVVKSMYLQENIKSIDIDIQDLPSGIYYVSLGFNNKLMGKTLLINN
jgi:hypothetical protein